MLGLARFNASLLRGGDGKEKNFEFNYKTIIKIQEI